MKIAPARGVAYRLLLQMEATDAHSDDLLRAPEVDALSPQDRHLTTTLVLGTLRWQLALDARIRPLLARPGAKLSPAAATALRMAAYQLLYLERIPAYAAINDSVELVKQSPERGAAGMVNAVLRKIAAQPRAVPPQHPRSAQEIAAAWAHPDWMVARWVRRYGLQAAQAICQGDQEPAGVTIRLADPEIHPEGIETEPGVFLSIARRIIHGDPSAAFRARQLRMQDEASQLVAEIAAAAAPVAGPAAARVLDTCAAPGGKTAVLLERLPQAQITALDVSRKRLQAAQAALHAESAPNLRFQVADATRVQLEPEYGLILCDVPCSGTGTLARNPEIRLHLKEGDLPRQQARQAAILRAGLAGLASGGRLVYSTCSLEPEENEAVVAQVLDAVPGLRIVPVEDLLDWLAGVGMVTAPGRERLRTATERGFLRTLPGIHPCDGFFAAVIERR